MRYKRYQITIFKLSRETWRDCVGRWAQRMASGDRTHREWRAASAVARYDIMRRNGTGPRLAAFRAILYDADLYIPEIK